MTQEYINLVDSFKDLDDDDKRLEIIDNIKQLLMLLYETNNSLDYNNNALPILSNYSNDTEYYDALFTSVISLKEEVAKLILNTKDN